MRRVETLQPGDTDRAVFVGQTGSGKTTLAEQLCRLRAYVVVLDPKGLITWKGYTPYTTLAQVTAAKEARVVYRPVYEELQDDETMDAFFEWCYRRLNTTVYVDEVMAVAQGDVYPWHFGACLTRGRERGVVMYCATQRPARIPQIVFSESEHGYVFKLKLPRDRERVEDMMGIPADAIAGLPKHVFFHAPQDGEAVGPLRLNLPSSGARQQPEHKAA